MPTDTVHSHADLEQRLVKIGEHRRRIDQLDERLAAERRKRNDMIRDTFRTYGGEGSDPHVPISALADAAGVRHAYASRVAKGQTGGDQA